MRPGFFQVERRPPHKLYAIQNYKRAGYFLGNSSHPFNIDIDIDQYPRPDRITYLWHLEQLEHRFDTCFVR